MVVLTKPQGVQRMTAHPAHVHRLPNTQAVEQRVVIDGLCVTRFEEALCSGVWKMLNLSVQPRSRDGAGILVGLGGAAVRCGEDGGGGQADVSSLEEPLEGLGRFWKAWEADILCGRGAPTLTYPL
jgi:hypothetical protein